MTFFYIKYVCIVWYNNLFAYSLPNLAIFLLIYHESSIAHQKFWFSFFVHFWFLIRDKCLFVYQFISDNFLFSLVSRSSLSVLQSRYFFLFLFPLLTLCSLLTLFRFFMSFGSSGFVIKVYSLLVHNKLISCFFCQVLFFYFVLVFRFLHFVSYILFLTNFISFFLGLGSSLQLRYIFCFSIFFITFINYMYISFPTNFTSFLFYGFCFLLGSLHFLYYFYPFYPLFYLFFISIIILHLPLFFITLCFYFFFFYYSFYFLFIPFISSVLSHFFVLPFFRSFSFPLHFFFSHSSFVFLFLFVPFIFLFFYFFFPPSFLCSISFVPLCSSLFFHYFFFLFFLLLFSFFIGTFPFLYHCNTIATFLFYCYC